MLVKQILSILEDCLVHSAQLKEQEGNELKCYGSI